MKGVLLGIDLCAFHSRLRGNERLIALIKKDSAAEGFGDEGDEKRFCC